LKLRLGRERLADDRLALEAVRKTAGSEVKLMVDFNQGLLQTQLDVYGEIADAMVHTAEAGFPPEEHALDMRLTLFRHLEEAWRQQDWGIWEVRGEPQHFTHSKVMTWVAFDRAARATEKLGYGGPADHWRKIADRIREEVCRNTFDEDLGTFVQAYGSKQVDASLLLLPLVGFLPPPGCTPISFSLHSKLKQKTRIGARVIKRYHAPAIPAARVLVHPTVAEDNKAALRRLQAQSNPVQLIAEMRAVQPEFGKRIDRRGFDGASEPVAPVDLKRPPGCGSPGSTATSVRPIAARIGGAR